MVDAQPVTEVFVPGQYPALTFNDRLTTDLKDSVTSYLTKGGGNSLLVYGSSKTGKTVLVERWLSPDHAIWIKGDEISSVNDLYARIIDDLGLFTERSSEEIVAATVGGGSGVEAGIGGILKFKLNADGSVQTTTTTGSSGTAMNVSVVKASLRSKPVPIVIDDFHFMDTELRLNVAKAVKDLARLTRVVLIAIPHAAFEPLRQLQDMDWRVRNLEVKRWETEELEEIARDGFKLLKIIDHNEVIGKRLAKESRGAPAIMQALCLEYATEVMGVWTTGGHPVDALEPKSWADFFHKVASERKPIAFDFFVNGKKTRGTERTRRVLHTGEATDNYGVVLWALRKMGVVSVTTKGQVAAKVAELVSNPPQPEHVSKTLAYLSAIANEQRGQGDPALTYQDPQLHILDPFLAFYLAHGAWSPPPAPIGDGIDAEDADNVSIEGIADLMDLDSND